MKSAVKLFESKLYKIVVYALEYHITVTQVRNTVYEKLYRVGFKDIQVEYGAVKKKPWYMAVLGAYFIWRQENEVRAEVLMGWWKDINASTLYVRWILRLSCSSIKHFHIKESILSYNVCHSYMLIFI